MSALQSQPLSAGGQFNWVFLIEILVVGILGLFFLFYFNRLFATLVSYGIRIYTWNKYKAYIDIGSLQISLLGGRLFFKNIRYHAHNVTVFVYEGHVTWRYWLRLVQEAEVFQEDGSVGNGSRPDSSTSGSDREAKDSNEGAKSKDGANEKPRARARSVGKEEKAGGKPKKELPCRISVKVSGVEAFIYNRSPVYDAVVEATTRKAREAAKAGENPEKPTKSPTSSSQGSSADEVKFGARPERTETYNTGASGPPTEKPEVPSFLHIFPIKIECKRAAAALGNENTKNVITAKTERSVGTVDAGHAGPLDLWKLLFNFEIQKVTVAMKPNRDFKEQQLDAARRVLKEREQESEEPKPPLRETTEKAQSILSRILQFFYRRGSSTESLRTASLKSRSKSVIGQPGGSPPLDQLPGQGQWHGLMRYLDDGEINEHEEWQGVEYAKASELVNCDKITMRFYWDMPGPVPNGFADNDTLLGSQYDDDINGTVPPDYGMDLGIYGGYVVYGPWADRQRLNLQPIFVPATYVDATPANPLKPGELRVCTVFKIKVIVEDDVVMRIPAREESKDTKWKGRAEKANPSASNGNDNAQGKGGHWRKHRRMRGKAKKGTATVDARPYGWIDITVKKDSVVNFNMDMYARPTGYRNTLDLDVKGVEMSSSVNHGLLWKSGPLVLDADISQPCTWNSLRKWPFNVLINDMELFILRDHLFLIIDLVNDWASGAPSDFYTFVPYNYQLDLTFKNFVMYLNVNDANIINDPADFVRNDYLTIEGQLHAILGIPMENYRPSRNQISFDVLAQDLKMRMISPPRSTFSTFVEDKVMADLPKLTLNGSYNANQEIRLGNVDVLRMDIVGTGLSLKAYGFFVRQLVSIKENYFGDYMHFKTLEEFQAASEDLEEANAKTASFPKPTSINELDVILCIVAEDATVMFPTNMYSCKEFVRAELPRADLDLRIVSYYLDMGLQLSPLSFLTGSSAPDDDDDLPGESPTQFFVKHVDLNGHRSFGLPPNEEAYVSQWDIDVGKITGELSSQFVRDLALAGRAFAFTIGDVENALPVHSPAIALDASFVQVRTDTVRLWMHVGKDALLLDVEPVKVETNDWASSMFSQRITVLAPLITVACADGRSASRHRARSWRKDPVRTYAFIQTGVSLDVVIRKAHFDRETKKQQAHFRLHDQRTRRFPFLIRPEIDAPINPEDDIHFEAPASQYPYPPTPLTRTSGVKRQTSVNSLSSLPRGRRLLSKSSSSSLSASIRSGRPAIVGKPRPVFLSRSTEKTQSSASFHSLAATSSRSTSPDSAREKPRNRLMKDAERAKFGLPSTTMAFSSPYSEPYFPLEHVEPDETNVPSFAAVDDKDGTQSETSSISDVILDPDIDPGAEHVTVMIKIVPGIRGYVEPRAAITASKLIRKVAPKHPNEVMDAFQMNVIGAILSQQAAKDAKSQIVEIQASLPAADLRVVALDENKDEIADQIDLRMKSLETFVRIRSEPSDTGVHQLLALHTLLAGLDVSLRERQDGVLQSPAVGLSVDDVLVWLALTSSNAFHVSFRDTSLAVAGEQTRYLSLLALKLIPVITDIMSRFEEVLANDLKRTQYLVYTLTHNGQDVGDPPFMTRLLFVLRAYPGHVRNTDSWNILARFRYILQNLSPDVLEDLTSVIKETHPKCPDDAPRRVLDSWASWQSWDVHINQTMVFKMLFSPNDIKTMDPYQAKATTLTFRSESFRIALEHAKGSSDIVLEETTLGVENVPPKKPEGLMLVEDNTRTRTTLQMHTSTIAFLLDWGLFHIAEDVISLKDRIDAIAASLESKRTRTAGQALEDGLSRHDFHATLSTDTGSVTLQTINLRHVSRADGLKMTLVGTNQAQHETIGQAVSATLNFDTAITELHGPTAPIWQTLLTSPSLYVDHLLPLDGSQLPPTVTVAVAYDALQIIVGEQVPGILHIVDSVILDEVAKCQRLAEMAQDQLAPTSPSLSRTTDTTVSRASTGASLPPKLYVAVLSGKLHLEVSLLSTLSFLLEGNGASVRVAPSLTKDKIFSIDFDVGVQHHAFVNTSANERHVQGLLEVPPINGHVGLEIGMDETDVAVATTIEKIEVDAAAIQGVLGVLNRPEVQNVITAIKGGVEDIRGHVIDLFPEDHRPKPKPDPKKQQQRVAYDVRFALLGVRVSASTPSVLGRSTAEVEFGIGPLHATASNRATPDEIIPNVRALVQEIGATLKIKENGKFRPVGNAIMGIRLDFSNHKGEKGDIVRELNLWSKGIEVNAYPDTASTVVDVINHLQDRIKHLDLSKEVDYLRRIRDERRQTVIQKFSGKESWTEDDELPFSPEDLLSIKISIEITDIQAAWIVDRSFAANRNAPVEDLVFSIDSVEFTTRGGSEARLTIKEVQLQLAKKKDAKLSRSLNSGLLPEVGFSVGYWKTGKHRSLTFKATGKPLDLRLESRFILPVNAVQKSIELAIAKFKKGTETWQSTPTSTGAPRSTMKFDTKHIGSLLVEADFAGAQVYMQGSGRRERRASLATVAAASQQHGSQHGRYGQFAAEGALMHTTLTAPGIGFKLEYNASPTQPTVNAELMIDASSNMLLPNVVPLMLEVSNSVKELVRNQKDEKAPIKQVPVPETAKSAQKFFEDDSIITATPAKIFGKTKVDIGFRIAKQEFGLSCQPIARVDAKATLEDFYVTMNTIDSDEHGHFFAASAVMTGLRAQVKHVYSREPTFSYDMDSIVLSAMNNKHLSGTPGVSAILNINPTRILINGKQFQDLLLFREIWIPPEIRNAAAAAGPAASSVPSTRPDDFLVQRYQTVAAAAAFPWNATVSIAKLAVDLDLGQSIGKSSFTITNLWASQQKSSNWEQNLCVGMDEMAINSTGRMSGFIQLAKLGVRTSIKWPEGSNQSESRKTPLIQASLGFRKLRAKAAFDYQAFAFGDIESFDFLMYNVRDSSGKSDRLVAVLDCEKAYVFCTSTSPAQAVGLYQAFDRLVQEKQTAYVQSLRDIEKHMRRESTVVPTRFGPPIPDSPVKTKEDKKSPIKLHTDVVVTMGAICFGVYPSTFFDSQMLKLEANNIQARFAVGLERGKITSGLGMTLGQLQVGLSQARRVTAVPKALEVTVDEVINSAINAKGGTILRVPKVIASMQTWQSPDNNNVDYIFKSLFDGKIDVGWNLSRINFIKGMWTSHSRALASRLGKSLPESAVKITATDESSSTSKDNTNDKQEKITAEINLPQSRYEYNALEPPVIETPQLRDMGEATPPLEWIGLHRDRLPNVTHQILIVSLLEVCREVEDAYEKILGSS
ncbi:hypothetical protein PRZ48_004056 [Zasmidium cellare]|uniref:Fermentation associated protein n=1 Tax=Zasmidium cellare TaxID=395010 RepID=A0ABR0EYC0_ZASCE|nr:hypothetical protein PRZ48_004056 [Zasmidium cellare]